MNFTQSGFAFTIKHVFFNSILQNSSSPGGSNDGLTKQQIELIQQIMQQTQQQQPANSQQSLSTSSAGISTQTKNGKPSSKSAHSPNGNSTSINPGSTNTTNSSSKAKIWNQNQVNQIYFQSLSECLV